MKSEPWFVEEAILWLQRRIEPGWTAFEWGSGGSTVWLSLMCAGVVSVEHDREWWAKVSEQIPMGNATVMLVPPGKEELGDDPAEPYHYRSSCRPGNFKEYARTIDGMGKFDLVMVDGRARASCIAHAVPKVRRFLVLDNAEREWYTEKTACLLEGWKRHDFWQGEWLTSVWEVPGGLG